MYGREALRYYCVTDLAAGSLLRDPSQDIWSMIIPFNALTLILPSHWIEGN